MFIFCNIYLVYKINIFIVENFKKSFSLLHLVGLRPQLYYTFTNFIRSGQGPLAPPPPLMSQWIFNVNNLH